MELHLVGLRSTIYRSGQLPLIASSVRGRSDLTGHRPSHPYRRYSVLNCHYRPSDERTVAQQGIRQARKRVQSAIAESQLRTGCSSRISIVGAGPTGLFAAICLCLKYGRLVQSASGKVKFRRNRPFPVIKLYERRARSDWGRRQQLIVLQQSVQTLLSKLLLTAEFQKSSIEINRIEKAFRYLLEHVFHVRVVERDIQGNRDLLNDGADVVIWAGGKSSPSPQVRSLLNMKYLIGQSDHVLVFTFDQLYVSRLQQVIHLVSVQPPLRILIRPGPRPGLPAKLWLVGIPPSSLHAPPSDIEYDSMVSAWNATGADEAIQDLLMGFESRIGLVPCRLQSVTTGYCRSNQPLAYVADDDGRHIPVLLIGDAAFCKPFYTGTTLNNHLFDVHTLVTNTDWNTSSINSHDHTAFRSYQRLFMNRIHCLRFTNSQCKPSTK